MEEPWHVASDAAIVFAVAPNELERQQLTDAGLQRPTDCVLIKSWLGTQ